MNMYAIAVYNAIDGTQTIVFANAQDEVDALHKQTEYPEWEDILDDTVQECVAGLPDDQALALKQDTEAMLDAMCDAIAQTDTIVAVKRVPDIVLP